MDLLLDTHVWIWAAESPDQFGPQAVQILSDSDNQLFVSTISTLEISRLVSAGRLRFSRPIREWIDESLASLQCATLELSHSDALAAYSLPEGFHLDPADRILVATARLRDLTLITADKRILDYSHVHTINVRA